MARYSRIVARLDTFGDGKSIDQPCVEFWCSKLLADFRLWEGIDSMECSPRDAITELQCVQALIREFNWMITAADAAEESELEDTPIEESIPEAESLPDRYLLDRKSSRADTLSDIYDELTKVLKIKPLALPDSLARERDRFKAEVEANGLYSDALKQNLQLLRESFGLSQIDTDIFALLLFAKTDRRFRGVLNCFDYQRRGHSLIMEVVAALLGLSEKTVAESLGRTGRLHESGLIEFETSCDFDDFEDGYSFFSDACVADFAREPISRDALLASVVKEPQKSTLTLGDYRHMPMLESVLLPYLRKAISERQKGVNILLYGPPGTGKTELSRLLAQELGMTCYEVLDEEEKDPRLKRWMRASKMLENNPNALLAVDEADDVFNCGLLFGEFRTNKANLNHHLEDNACPTIWLTNSIHSIDSAMIRRFRFVLRMEAPPASQRFELAKSALGDFVTESTLWRLAETKSVSPAIVDSIASIATNMRDAGIQVPEETLLNMIEEVLKAQGVRALVPKKSLSDKYDPTLTHSDMNLEELAHGIKSAGAARLCLYGPPGTGKTAYGHYLAKVLDCPLVVKRASDLLSMWVGGTEANIAAAFDEAKKAKAILLIDEADSFLRDRKSAKASWQVTQVNELLTQMENFEGVFVATTNLVESLDAASLRRFDMKAKFDFLDESQARTLFSRYMETANLPAAVDNALLERVGRLTNLTPGDFASVARQMRFVPDKSPEAFLSALVRECEVKEGDWSKRHPIGFC